LKCVITNYRIAFGLLPKISGYLTYLTFMHRPYITRDSRKSRQWGRKQALELEAQSIVLKNCEINFTDFLGIKGWMAFPADNWWLTLSLWNTDGI